ncbi:MAG: hypothetical protein A3G32_05780 [Deltaproteobacteria bacterium RIFCSPLOWO2_12_FULL_40_28]|nr:MAG: hypothetical protein A3C45_03950 [Deltaproteobacteria bacterium RIFCSPHIGHO2_02_FULL_40_28]OGQ18974.1 MAG: hypothetical protein A3E27_09780 [Deltaproteobacteria bacterium RIFCSPHIGHO2_12_FULL_40_32]OGQ39517.1 MAG: hypothetical protein A3I69_09895 [Deltaproteobacteria bacterium RIFCSPLOWO2_02_FULL_40_36]OGQ53407.1 MAG: hypothetical protein A3G32_05780 [Deltaproteobacteria bacterium RIFCSPLOWO2_12_FULL_40_28]
MKWIVKAPPKIEKMLRDIPPKVAKLYDMFLNDLERDGPFPKGWQIGFLAGKWDGYLKAKLKRNYRVIYRYESNIITVFIEKIADRKDIY